MKAKKTIFFLMLMLAVNGIAVAGWFYLYSVISEQRYIINKARHNLTLIEKKAEDSRSLKKLMDGIKEERLKIDSIFLDEESIINFIEELEMISDKTGASLEFNSISINEKSGAGPNFRLRLFGGYNEIFRYVGLLENVPYQIIIKRVYIQSTKKGWTSDVNLILTSFKYNEEV